MIVRVGFSISNYIKPLVSGIKSIYSEIGIINKIVETGDFTMETTYFGV